MIVENTRFSSVFSGKKPDYTEISFFFVRQQNVCVVDTFYRTKLLDRQPETYLSKRKDSPFIYYIFNVRYKTGRDNRVPPLSLSALCNFFRNFLSPKGPLHFFFIFCNTLEFQKPNRVPDLATSGLFVRTCDRFWFAFHSVFGIGTGSALGVNVDLRFELGVTLVSICRSE